MKYRIAGMVVALMLALLPLSAFAQTGSTGVDNSGFQVVNLGSAAANVVVTYYQKDGTVASTQNVTIQPNSSYTFFGSTMQVPAGFNGSVVVSSDQPIAAITNLINNAGTLAGSYGGFNGGSQNVGIPLIERANFGIDTWFNVQNAGSTAATVTITYVPTIGNSGVTDTATIAPGAAASFFQKDKTALGDRFVGSATVSSNQPIVATVNEESGKTLFTYDAFTGGSTSISAPLILGNNFGNYTGFQIQNVGTAAADITLTYSPNAAGAGGGASACPTPSPKTYNVAAGGSKTVIQSNIGPESEGFDLQFNGCRYVGSATVSSAQPLVGIVNQVGNTNAGSAYEIFNPTTTTATTVAPLLQSNNFGLFSGVQVQNTGSASASVTVTYGANTADATQNPAGQVNCQTPAARTQTIAAGASFTFIQLNLGSDADGFDSQFNGCRYIGSATITASGGTVAAIVNQTTLSSSGDNLQTYDTFSQ